MLSCVVGSVLCRNELDATATACTGLRVPASDSKIEPRPGVIVFLSFFIRSGESRISRWQRRDWISSGASVNWW